jgi:hypothetical protein
MKRNEAPQIAPGPTSSSQSDALVCFADGPERVAAVTAGESFVKGMISLMAGGSTR